MHNSTHSNVFFLEDQIKDKIITRKLGRKSIAKILVKPCSLYLNEGSKKLKKEARKKIWKSIMEVCIKFSEKLCQKVNGLRHNYFRVLLER